MKQLIGNSRAIKEINNLILQVAPKGSTVLIRGESGTGKELVAELIHYNSNRRFNPLIKINCAAIPEPLLEAEFFGYTEGAFTGAKKGGAYGKFYLADKGTIFLDEIGDLSLSTQAKLLRVLQDKVITPLGSETSYKLDVRIIAATNANLEEMVRSGLFREDLFYRLNVISILMPTLRDRKEDIIPLTKVFIKENNIKFGLEVSDIEDNVKNLFLNYNWPGNVRELKNVLEYAFNLIDGKTVRCKHLPAYLSGSIRNTHTKDYLTQIGQRSFTEIMDEIERIILQEALSRTDGNKAKTAELLGLSRPGLYKKLKKHKLL